MKRSRQFFSVLFVLISVSFANALIPVLQSGPAILFETLVYDFGTIKRHADGTCSFVFKNTGDSPLLITKVSASCGCTVPSYPKAPILPGESETVKVAYNTKTVGVFSKTINVSTNDPQHPTVVLTIKGAVVR